MKGGISKSTIMFETFKTPALVTELTQRQKSQNMQDLQFCPI